ncbi:MAG TPA: TonB-dependent receptor [Prolixibacteraceae bacterium]|nr:TonB-dependent receptor [Prolixibacteraceae bacterium]
MKKNKFHEPKFRYLKKLLMTMKICLFFLLISAVTVTASVGYSQNTKLSLNLQNATIQELIKEIENQSEFIFVFYDNALDLNQKINIQAENQTVEKILEKVLEPTGNTFAVFDRQIVIGKKNPATGTITDQNLINSQVEQKKDLSGIVKDKNGLLMPGVTVVVKSTTIGTITDTDGKFSLPVPTEAKTLVFSFVGMITQEVAITGKTKFDIVLEEQIVGIEEVVAVGYGTMKKSDLTGSISRVTQNELKDRPNNNVMQSVAGKVAGVQILQTDGTAGYAPTVRIRGAASITAGTTPLYVVDGIPIEGANLNILNPGDIESMEILKDASSSAIYGSRGSNGVVIITTKSGKSGKTNVEINFEKGFSKVLRTIDMMNAQQWIKYHIDAVNNSWIARGGRASDPNEVRPSNLRIPPEFLSDPAKFGNGTNWQDVIFRVAPTDNASVSMNGGNDKTRFMISSSYLKQIGIVDGDDFERLTLRANLTHKITSNLSMGTNILLTKRNESPMVGFDLAPEIGKNTSVSGALQSIPIFPIYNENGNYGPSDPNSEWKRFSAYGLGFVHPYIRTRQMDRKRKSFNTLSNIFVEWKFLPDFTFKSVVSATIDYSRLNVYQYDKVKYGWSALPAARAYSSNDYRNNWLSENTVTFNKTIGEHSINAFAGYSVQKDSYEEGRLLASGFPNDQVHTLNAATTVLSFSSTASEWSLLSYIGRVNYSYLDKYLLTATLRRDGSSRFGKNNKWGYFPSASAGWRLSEEDFIKSVSWIDNLKLRLSYGVTGNNLIPNYGSVGLLAQSQYAWGNNAEAALYINSISNSDLRWEKTGQWNLGLNIGLFSNRIYMELDYYQSVTNDMLLNVPVPAITGFTSQLTNIGKLKNRGFEFLISTKNLVGDFKWNTDFNISTNRNKVSKLGLGDAPIYTVNWQATTITEIGQPMANFYGYIFDGVFMNQSEVDNYPHVASTTPGDPKIRDVNGDKIINADDRTVLGNYQPDFTFGLTNTFQYKSFDLNFTLQGQYGNEIINTQTRFTKFYGGSRNQYAIVSNYWKSESDPGDGKIFKPMFTFTGLQTAFSSYWIEDGSFLRIRNVQFGYSLPQKAISWSPFSSVRVYVNAENLHVFTSYIGFDPENSVYSGLELGSDYGATPMPRTVTFGIKVNL